MAFKNYPGGKSGSGVYQKIINLLPPHRVYIEPFLGGGAIMRLKRPAIASIGIDRDDLVLYHWRGNEVPNLELIHADALDYLASNTFTADTLIYLDPPYLMQTRSTQEPIYRFEMSDQQHEQLLEIVNCLPCMVVISGYASDLYQSYLASWRTLSFQAMTRSGKQATETVWLNFPEPYQLHDYRYLGENYREHERIKRKQKRWANRLAVMPPQERYALLSVIQSAVSPETAVLPAAPPQPAVFAGNAAGASPQPAALDRSSSIANDEGIPDNLVTPSFLPLTDPIKELDHGF